MFPAETWSEIGGWLSDYSDFSNLAVALGVKWNPATQAQRMIRKYGNDFLEHVAIGDELAHWDSGATRSDRRYILFSTQQMDFYRYLLWCMPEVIGRCLDFPRPERVHWQHLEAFLHLGARIPLLTVPFLQYVIEDFPAVVELLVENGIIGDHNFYADAAFIEKELFYDPFLLYSWVPWLIRWGIPMDLDSLLRMTVEYTTTEYEPLEIDRINNKFDPRTQFQAQMFIQQLLEFGADPNILVGVKTPTDPVVTEILLQHGADPGTLGWPRSGWIWGSEKDRISLWCQYGWLPTVDDADLYFSCLLNWKRWDLVDVFLRHFKRNLVGVVEKKGLSIAIKARQLDLVKRMVTTFPEIFRKDSFIFMQIIDWYVETDWQLDLELVEMLLSNDCAVNSRTIWTCIEANQQEITRKALFQPVLSPCPNPLDSDPHGPAWAPKLVRDMVRLRQREDRQRACQLDGLD
ncbi:hypothetical protein HK102_002634 [Quaeritorhiza haematococci]|nr:hypothetical protein HK102_002634 [Quaeritorhiza haematococci]